MSVVNEEPSCYNQPMKKSAPPFELKKFLSLNQKRVDQGLELYLPPAEGVFKTVHEAMRYSIFAGGKRVRPILCLAAYAIFREVDSNEEKILPTASALEMIHTYSLIHDDLPCMDNDDFRRGKPTNHKVFGEAIAVLAGDALLTLAFEVVAKTENVSSIILNRVIQELARTSGTLGLIGGQVEDLEAEGKNLSGPQLESIHRHKTAALIQTSIRLGGILGECREEELQRLTLFGEKVGLAFQIVDDILDEESDTASLGKTAGKDKQQKKSTYPSVYGLPQSKKMAEQLKNEAIEAIEPFAARAAALKSLALYMIERKN